MSYGNQNQNTASILNNIIAGGHATGGYGHGHNAQAGGVSGFSNIGGAAGAAYEETTGAQQLSNDMDFGLPQASNDTAGLSIAIRKVYLGETRKQHQQHQRNYSGYIDGETFSKLQDSTHQDPNVVTNAFKLSEFLSETGPIVRYSGVPEQSVGIENGWDTKRFRFTLVVDVYRNGRYVKTEFVAGYTDSMGVNNISLDNSVTIDPGMVFRINQISDAAGRRVMDNGSFVPQISGSHQVLQNTDYVGLAGPQKMTMNPSDVVGVYNRLDFYRGADELADADPAYGGMSSMRDMNVQLVNTPMYSSADNSLVNTYTTRIVRAIKSSNADPSEATNPDPDYMNYGMEVRSQNVNQKLISEGSFVASNFVNMLNRMLANGIVNTATFTFGDLLQLDRTIDDRTSVFGLTFNDHRDGLYIPDRTDVSDIGRSSTCAIAATCISNALIQLMNKAGVQMLAIRMDNLSGVDNTLIQGVVGMDYDGELSTRLSNLQARLIVETVPIFKPDPMSVYEVDILADAFNDVFVQIRINNNYDQFLIPAYASSAFAPVITSDMGNLVGLANSIDRILDATSVPGGGGSTSNQSYFSGVGTGSSPY